MARALKVPDPRLWVMQSWHFVLQPRESTRAHHSLDPTRNLIRLLQDCSVPAFTSSEKQKGKLTSDREISQSEEAFFFFFLAVHLPEEKLNFPQEKLGLVFTAV